MLTIISSSQRKEQERERDRKRESERETERERERKRERETETERQRERETNSHREILFRLNKFFNLYNLFKILRILIFDKFFFLLSFRIQFVPAALTMELVTPGLQLVQQ